MGRFFGWGAIATRDEMHNGMHSGLGFTLPILSVSIKSDHVTSDNAPSAYYGGIHLQDFPILYLPSTTRTRQSAREHSTGRPEIKYPIKHTDGQITHRAGGSSGRDIGVFNSGPLCSYLPDPNETPIDKL